MSGTRGWPRCYGGPPSRPGLFLFRRPGSGSIQRAGRSPEGIESRQHSKVIDIISIIGTMSHRREDYGATTDHGPGGERDPRGCV